MQINRISISQYQHTTNCLKPFPLALLIVGLMHFGIGVQAQGQAPEPTASDWKSKIITQRSFDFGEVRIGSKATHTFELSNPTENNLEIQSVASSCGCTVAGISNKTIAPNSTEKITISLNTEAFRGKRNSTITVRFSEPANHEIQLSVNVDIKNLYIDPEPVVFRSIEITKPATQTIVATRKGSPFWKIEQIVAEDPQLEAKIVKREIRGTEVKYQIECTLVKEEPGMFQTALIMKTNDSFEREYRIPVHIESVEPLRASVSAVEFGESEIGAEKKFIVSCVEPCRIVGLSVSNDGFEVSQVNPDHKTRHILQVVRKSMEHASATIEIKTDFNDQAIQVEVIATTVQ